MSEQVPQSVTVECAECGEETLHRTLKGRYSGKKRLEMVLKCAKCGKVRNHVLTAIGLVQLKLVISRGDISERTTVQLPADWGLKVGDEFMHEDERLQVKAIEVGGVKVNSAATPDIQALWTISFNTVHVKVSINRHGRTRSLDIETDPEDEFIVGSEIDIDDTPVYIHSIKLKDKTIRRGSAAARDIVRIYCTDAREPREKSDRE